MSHPAAPVPIRTEGLTKHYKGVHAIEDLDLEVQRGEVFGFLGPNGAGKTTTIRALLHFIFPTRGPGQHPGPRRGPRVGGDQAPCRLHAGRLRPLPQPDRRRDAALLRQPARRCGRAGRGGPGRAPGGGPLPQERRPLQRQPPEGGAHRRLHERARAAHPRRAQQRPRPAHAAGAAGHHPGGPRRRAHRLPLQPQPVRGRARGRPGGHPARGPPHRRRARRHPQGQGHPAPGPRVRGAGRAQTTSVPCQACAAWRPTATA